MVKPRSSSAFQTAYHSLNPQQKLAVDTLDGPVMVIAGPGTGKTQILSVRIANILRQTDTDPSAILALTFTDSGATAMRQRLFQLIGPTAYRLHVSTFHSFASSLISEFPDQFIYSSNAQPATDLQRYQILTQILNNNDFHKIKPANSPLYYLQTGNALPGAIATLKREGVSPSRLKTLLDEELKDLEAAKDTLKKTEFEKRQTNLFKNLDLFQVYSLYQDELKKRHLFDFDDMINWVLDQLQAPDSQLLPILQERFHYFLVDEYQDTNSAQNQIVDLLASYWGDRTNLFVVGDDEQCLPARTKIFTQEGEKNIEDIVVGDKVLSAVGKGYTSFIPVTNVFRYQKKVRLITFTTSSGATITATHNHKMFCFTPPREKTEYWYVYLMHKKNYGWRLGTTQSLPLRLKIERQADKIFGLLACDSESEARFQETLLSLTYQIPTTIFHPRTPGAADKNWIRRLFDQFDTETNAQKLALHLGIDLSTPHCVVDGTTRGQGRFKVNLHMCYRNYRSKHDKQGLLNSPNVSHEVSIQTSNPSVLKSIQNLGFELKQKNIGQGFSFTSTNLKQAYDVAQKLAHATDGILDLKASFGTVNNQHRPARIVSASNILPGNYLPVLQGYRIVYEKVVSRKEENKTTTVYDLEVTPSHNFIANNIVVHNSIYRFQGASLENALNFKKTYPSAQIITLTHNYRSQPTILSTARSLIERNTHNLQSTFPSINRHLQATVDYPEKKLTLATFPSEIFERSYLATQVRALLDQQVSPSQIAIIVNTNAEIAPLSQVFSHFQLPHQTTSDQDLLTTPIIRYLLKLFSVISKSRSAVDDLDLFTLLHYPFLKVDSFTLLTHARAAALQRLPLFDYLRQAKTDLTPLLERIAHWNTLDSTLTFTEFFETILQESGLLDWALATPESSQHLRHLSSLFDFVKQLNAADHELNLVSFLSTIDLWQSNRLHIDTPVYNLSPDKITLTTAHKAKGQEWEHVFVPGCIDGRWGNKSNRQLLALPTQILRSDQDHDPLEDERRLFYVALTRAKKTLTLTYSQEILSYHRLRQTLPSQFLAELPSDLLEVHQPKPDTQQVDQLLRTLITPSPSATLSATEAEFIRSILADFKLSVTALDTYLDCPYKFKLNNLFKVPKAKASYLSFGTAVHSALEKFFRHHHHHAQFPDHQFLLDRFEEALKAEVLSPSDYRQRLLQGRQMLQAYYDLHLKEARPALETEKYFGSHYHPIFLDDIPLSGKVDRIDWLDPQQKTVTVVDYKTGKHATRGQIEGHTQDSDGRLKRQLVFYKLLSDLDTHFPYTVTSAELDFVGRPHTDKKSGKESFSITPQEITELKALIKATMANIRSLNFPRTTDTSICSRCEFINHCWPQGLEMT